MALQQQVRGLYVDRGVVDYAVNLVLATRNPAAYGMAELAPLIEFGASPRASLGLVAAGRALAMLRGRSYVLPQDVFDVAPEILRHRLVLSYEALAQGLVTDQLSARILSTVPAPRVTPLTANYDQQSAQQWQFSPEPTRGTPSGWALDAAANPWAPTGTSPALPPPGVPIAPPAPVASAAGTNPGVGNDDVMTLLRLEPAPDGAAR